MDHVVYSNPDNGYTVIEVSTRERTLTLVGNLFYVNEGVYVRAEGDLVQHPLYGEQLKVKSIEITMPQDEAAIERYLASGAIKGIGPALAGRIVEQFGTDTFRVMEEEPELLARVKGISRKTAVKLSVEAMEQSGRRQAIIFLQDFGIGLNLAIKIYEAYKDDLYSIIRTNPYKLSEDISGVGFKIADNIAVRSGIPADSEFRIRSGLLFVMNQAAGEGHTYLPEQSLIRYTASLLEISTDQIGNIDEILVSLIMEKKLVVKEEGGERRIYLNYYYFAELDTARRLCDLAEAYEAEDQDEAEDSDWPGDQDEADNLPGTLAGRAEAETKDWPEYQNGQEYQKEADEIARHEWPAQILGRMEAIEAELSINLEEKQKEGFLRAVTSGIMVLTGGPGTGKTTIIRSIIRYFEEEGCQVALAAPTGRAAKRMQEATGMEAKTIHRLLEISRMDEDDAERAAFSRNEENPLEADVIIIDECSMVDISLMNSLLKAVPVGARLILVGDVDQLPSVGPGNVLRDIIVSGRFPVVRLEKIFRQAAMSDIIVNAHKINSGQQVNPAAKSRDFLFIRGTSPESIIDTCAVLVQDKLPGYVRARTEDIQIMTPMRKGPLGVGQLNEVLQARLNPPSSSKREKQVGDTIYRVGDKVMQIKNNYQLVWERRGRKGIVYESGTGVFNGDTGVITSINTFSEELDVLYDDGHYVTYGFKMLDELELAYAITVHKSQGSEYPAVVLPLLSGPSMLMTRNLLYTAVTRAKSCVCIVGSPETFSQMINNERRTMRYTSLAGRIREIGTGIGI